MQGYTVFAGVRKAADACSLRATDTTGLLQPLLLDVTDDDSVHAALEQIRAQLGTDAKLAGLVNNAGKGTFAPLELMPVSVFEDTLAVNLVGVMR